LIDIFDYLTCLEQHGHPLPGQLTKDQLQYINEVAMRMYWAPFLHHKEMAKLGIGRLFHEVSHHMQKMVNGQSKYKMILYAGHDGTIGPLLGALQVNIYIDCV
jgi:hypothetical protein